jgi:hypothetical protein
MFEVPLHSSTAIDSIEDIKNSFTAFKASDVCAVLWNDITKKYIKDRPIRIRQDSTKEAF